MRKNLDHPISPNRKKIFQPIHLTYQDPRDSPLRTFISPPSYYQSMPWNPQINTFYSPEPSPKNIIQNYNPQAPAFRELR